MQLLGITFMLYLLKLSAGNEDINTIIEAKNCLSLISAILIAKPDNENFPVILDGIAT